MFDIIHKNKRRVDIDLSYVVDSICSYKVQMDSEDNSKGMKEHWRMKYLKELERNADTLINAARELILRKMLNNKEFVEKLDDIISAARIDSKYDSRQAIADLTAWKLGVED